MSWSVTLPSSLAMQMQKYTSVTMNGVQGLCATSGCLFVHLSSRYQVILTFGELINLFLQGLWKWERRWSYVWCARVWKQQDEIAETCFICGLSRKVLDLHYYLGLLFMYNA